MTNKFAGLTLVIFLLLSLSGCARKWTPNWQEARPDLPTEQSAQLLRDAQLIFDQAKDRDSLLASMQAYQQGLAENAGDYQALTALSTQHILLGTAYTVDRTDKSTHFHQAMRYAELAMYTNTEFKNQIAGGTAPWDAVETLDREQVEAMFFWVTALQYDFKEGMNLATKIINVRWMQRGLKFLDRIEQVDPDFGGGSVEFAKVICYYVLPKTMGGSKIKGDTYMARAVSRSDGWLLPRWARGKYFYKIKGDDEKARKDLEWVVAQDLSDYKDPTPWKTHFQENAKELLN